MGLLENAVNREGSSHYFQFYFFIRSGLCSRFGNLLAIPRHPMETTVHTGAAPPPSLNEIMPQIYAELHKIASSYMRREREGHTLQPTALVNEAYLRLLTQHSVDFSNRAHVLGVAAQMMRRILVTHAEKRSADKRGGEYTLVNLADSAEPAAAKDLAFSDVDEALKRLTAIDERQASVVELRILGGMTAEEIAEFLGISVATVHRDWASGRLWLARELSN